MESIPYMIADSYLRSNDEARLYHPMTDNGLTSIINYDNGMFHYQVMYLNENTYYIYATGTKGTLHEAFDTAGALIETYDNQAIIGSYDEESNQSVGTANISLDNIIKTEEISVDKNKCPDCGGDVRKLGISVFCLDCEYDTIPILKPNLSKKSGYI